MPNITPSHSLHAFSAHGIYIYETKTKKKDKKTNKLNHNGMNECHTKLSAVIHCIIQIHNHKKNISFFSYSDCVIVHCALLIIFIVFVFVLFCSHSDKSLPEDERQRLLSNIESKLEEKPSKLNRFNGIANEVIVTNGMTPTNEYEQLRRRIRSNIGEMYNYVGSELTKLLKNHNLVPEIGENIERIMQMTTDHKRSLVNDMDQLQKIDGYEQWRRNEAESLSNLVQRRLKYLQNPEDCSKARKLVCRLNKVSETIITSEIVFVDRLKSSTSKRVTFFSKKICIKLYVKVKLLFFLKAIFFSKNVIEIKNVDL